MNVDILTKDIARYPICRWAWNCLVSFSSQFYIFLFNTLFLRYIAKVKIFSNYFNIDEYIIDVIYI